MARSNQSCGVDIERTYDVDLIERVLKNPRIYRAMGDDFSPALENYRAPDPSRVVFLACYVENSRELLGLFAFNPMSPVLFLAHTCLLPCAWGERAIAAGKAAIGWMWENSPAERIIGMTPAYNRLALRLAKRCGFQEFGVNPRCHMRGGVLHDEVLTGVSKWV